MQLLMARIANLFMTKHRFECLIIYQTLITITNQGNNKEFFSRYPELILISISTITKVVESSHGYCALDKIRFVQRLFYLSVPN